MVSMMEEGEMMASSMAAEGETTGMISMGSLLWGGIGG